MVLTHSHVLARVVDCASLTDDDVSGLAGLAAEYLDA